MHMLGHHSQAATAGVATRGHVLHWARFYDPLVTLVTLGRASAMREQAADLAAIQPGQSVLDVGCGTGELTQRAHARAGASGLVCGIDPSAEMIAVARRKAARAGIGIDYRIAAIEALPYPDASFDRVLSSLMMHHLPGDLKSLGLAEVRRVLKPDGRLLIVDLKRPRGFLAHLTVATLVHHGAADGLEDLPALVQAAGFTDIESGGMRFSSLGYVSARAPG